VAGDAGVCVNSFSQLLDAIVLVWTSGRTGQVSAMRLPLRRSAARATSNSSKSFVVPSAHFASFDFVALRAAFFILFGLPPSAVL
jgi:hypothetical protein